MNLEGLLSVLWPAALVLPLLLAAGMTYKGTRALSIALTPLSPLPALGLAVFGEDAGVDLPYILIGMSLGLTDATRVFLLFTALLWTIAAVYARGYMANDYRQPRFFAFFLITMTGNLGLIMSRDLASFYLFFSLMSFFAYGMVVHEATEKARKAAHVYLIMTILAEACLLPAVLITAGVTGTIDLGAVPAGLAGSEARDTVVLLATLGFGVKAGAFTLHLWLPLAHPAAPTPASAVLSGTMIKAGLLGWMLLIPAGEVPMPFWGVLFMAAGLVAAFYGVLVGLTQGQPKTILAYSSISQMGFMTAVLGAAIAVPEAWPVALFAIPIYAAHHALIKGALFLGVGVAERTEESRHRFQRLLVIGGLVLAALALAGAPLTSGAAAKDYLKGITDLAPLPWDNVLYSGLDLAAVGSTLIMARFLFAVWPPAGGQEQRPPALLFVPWLVSVGGVAALVLFLPETLAELPGLLLTFEALWPLAAGVLLVTVAWYLDRRFGGKPRERLVPAVPEGDLLIPVTRSLSLVRRGWKSHAAPSLERSVKFVTDQGEAYASELVKIRTAADRLESWAQVWIVAGALALMLVLTVLALSVLV
ncbi:MAG: hypothetical protein H0V53_06810 [Rubrobacter sp.]|nr:hypothetical protein [Rubrobacter sp.]